MSHDAGGGDKPPAPTWTPSADRIEQAAITRFAAWAQDRTGTRLTDSYDQLWRWSVDDIAGFWSTIWTYFDVQADGRHEPVLHGRALPGARWFPDARLNYAEHVLRGQRRGQDLR